MWEPLLKPKLASQMSDKKRPLVKYLIVLQGSFENSFTSTVDKLEPWQMQRIELPMSS